MVQFMYGHLWYKFKEDNLNCNLLIVIDYD